MCQCTDCGVILPLAAAFFQEGFSNNYILPPPRSRLRLWGDIVLCQILAFLFFFVVAWVDTIMSQGLEIFG